jgi:hypothetical protein
MADGNDNKKFTKAEIEAILQENNDLKEKLKKRSGGGNNWAKTKERMATDPEFAAKVKQKRAERAAKQKEILASDPVKAADKKAKQKAYRDKVKAEFKAWKADKASSTVGAIPAQG